ncbi:MAG: hypothetical protein KAV87_64020 [Desulfobacteraceae bacterium]|nr:hypothetical protein [Desulfobacteraceae bacterium]
MIDLLIVDDSKTARRMYARQLKKPDYNPIVANGVDFGLAISKNIIEHYGGSVWLKSKPRKWSGFSFSLLFIKT